ncbi:MAG: hypothetical protein AAF098_08700, partial [Pseudomonadota bacterium]
FSTNQIVLTEIERLAEVGSSRIKEIQHTIAISEHSWYLNWSPRLNMIIFEFEAPREMTKREKKSRSKGIRRGDSAQVGYVFQVRSSDDVEGA